MSINDRIRELRKGLGLTQAELADKVGLKHGAISKLEKNGNTVTEQNIRIICDKFGVARSWLETGEGEMYLPASRPEGELERLTKAYSLSAQEQALIAAFIVLPEESRAGVIHYVERAALAATSRPLHKTQQISPICCTIAAPPARARSSGA